MGRSSTTTRPSLPPFTYLTRKDVKFASFAEAGTTFHSLQHAFTTASISQHFQPKLPLIIEANASEGCILSQPSIASDLHLVCFYSSKFTPAELNYPIYDKEMLAVLEAFKKRRVYVEGAAHPVRIFTDHKNL